MPKIEGVLFDCDGVLLDTDTPYRKIVADILTNRFNYPITTQQAVDRWKGKNMVQIAQELAFENCDFVDELLKPEFISSLSVDIDHTAIIKNVKVMLEQVKLPKGVCSNGRTVRILNNFKSVDLLNQFEFICGRDQLNAMKPNPQVYLAGAEKLGIDIEHCLVVEDSVSGLSAGIASGATTVAFVGCGGVKSDLEKLSPDYIIDDLLELPRIIEELNS